jgi:transposase-like protein/IS1 family transposase
MSAVKWRKKAITHIACPNRECTHHSKHGKGNIVGRGYSKLKRGRRRRFRCSRCGRTFGATTGTPYERLQHSMRAFDRVAALSVEGVSKSAIARIEMLSWNTVSRWLERAALFAKRFNKARTPGFILRELQFDELKTFLWSKKRVTWIFTAIEVWSRLWPATVVGSRTFKNTKQIVRDVFQGSRPFDFPLISTDGFKFYAPAIRLVFGIACVLGQVIKKIRKNRVARVDTKLVIGSEWKLDGALLESEDSNKLNTAFIERHNLTVRQGSAYLNRPSPCHARKRRCLEDHLELLRYHYNFVRPHAALRFGDEVRTPAMQAGLVARKLSLRDTFTARIAPSRFVVVRSGRGRYQRTGWITKWAA